MTRGFWDIPVPDMPEVVTPDIVSVPLLGGDTHGFRLGNGGGYFDHTLARLPDARRFCRDFSLRQFSFLGGMNGKGITGTPSSTSFRASSSRASPWMARGGAVPSCILRASSTKDFPT